jgi:TetR/AcrR family transcriptional regulator, repressor for neighboring sulfatase
MRPHPHRTVSRPKGRDEVRAAVIDAAARHFAAAGTRASLRDIADDAGVNLGLIHRHVGNKDDLLRAVLERQRRGGVEVVAGVADPGEAVQRIFELSARDAQHVRTLAWLMLEGDPVVRVGDDWPAIRALRSRLGDDERSQRSLLAAFAIIYGWTVFGEQLLSAFELDPDRRDDVERWLADHVRTLVGTGDAADGARSARSGRGRRPVS